MTRIAASCHCGNVRLTLDWPAAEPIIGVRECGCSFCRKHAGAWTSHPQAALRARIADPESVSRYRFGTGTADFHVCAVCGAVPFVSCTIDDRLYAVVNVHTFDEPGTLTLSRSPSDFDGEDVGSRLERRRSNWIADVVMD